MSNTVELNNGTGNRAYGKNSVAMGQGCVAMGDNQSVYGSYPEFTADTSTDKIIFGGGSKNSPATIMRVKEDGELVVQGGEVYMNNPDTGEIQPVYMLGNDNRLKKVLMSK